MSNQVTPAVNAVATLIEQRKGARLTSRQAADYVGVSPGTLEVWRCKGRFEIPYMKIGRKVLYDVADLDAFIASRRVVPPAAAA